MMSLNFGLTYIVFIWMLICIDTFKFTTLVHILLFSYETVSFENNCEHENQDFLLVIQDDEIERIRITFKTRTMKCFLWI